MSILLTSPAYLLGLPAIRWGFGRSRLVTGAGLAVLIIAFVNLLHFSQGWVQFGYRFSLDFAPWAILLVAIGLERIAARTTAAGPTGRTLEEPAFGIDRRAGAWAIVAVAIVLVAVSVFVNLWGVVWGDVLGW
jgi:hypothetical protein